MGLALNKKAFDPTILAVSEVAGYTDHVVLLSGRNPRQVRAIAEEIRVRVKAEQDRLPIGVEGVANGKWVLLDYGDVVVHVFHEGTRGFYDLEKLLAEAPRLPVPEALAPSAFDLSGDDDGDDDEDDDGADDELASLYALP